MTAYTVTSTARINAPASVTYGVIADYRTGHPHILPPKYFRNLRVDAGGVGAGTHIRFEMGAMGSWREAGAVVSEPEPGRLLHEQVTTAPIETTFIVEPVDAGACDVTIATRMVHRGGIGGGLERLATTAFLRRVYRAELTLLDQVARSRT